MFSREFPQFIPIPDATQDVLEAHGLAWEFRQEVQYREDFDRYCQWYYETAERNRREFEEMKNDINFFGWFNRRR